jgi:hypothetical protein
MMAVPVPVTIQCIEQAANLQQVPVAIILGLLKTEGGRVGSQSRNNDGSLDLGPMQINNRAWGPIVARMHFEGNLELAEENLRDFGCYNIHIGTWIFKQYVNEAGGNLAEAVGFYNSHTPVKKLAYQRRFISNFIQLFGPHPGAGG